MPFLRTRLPDLSVVERDVAERAALPQVGRDLDRDPREVHTIAFEQYVVNAAVRAVAELHPAAAVVLTCWRYVRTARVDGVIPGEHVSGGWH